MKKAVSILLMLSFILPFWGAFSLLQFQKYQIKADTKAAIKKGLAPEELILLTFAKEEAPSLLHWKHDWEFEYDGQMYDVVEKHVEDDSLSYLVFWDYEETKVKRKLNRLVSEVAKPFVHDRKPSSIRFFKLNIQFFDQPPVYNPILLAYKFQRLPLASHALVGVLKAPSPPPPQAYIFN
ncbi:MAG: hypothetical protein WC967_07830 [Balneolaceae bacterium]